MQSELKHCLAALMLAGLASPVLADDSSLEFHGYMRAGVGVNTKGGGQVCFNMNGVSHWRLGNECDYTIEPTFIYNAAKSPEYGNWKITFMPSVYRAYGQGELGGEVKDAGGNVVGNFNGTDELVTRFGQVFISSEKIPALGNGGVWAGRRFYDRVQLGINDHFLENHDSDGAGIENVEVGAAKFSYAFLMNPRTGTTSANEQAYEHAFRVTDIPTFGKDHALDIYFGRSDLSSSENQTTGAAKKEGDATTRLGLYHKSNGLIGNGGTLIGFRVQTNDASRNAFVAFQQTGSFGATAWDFITEFHRNTDKVTDKSTKIFTLGGRTDTHIAGPFRFLAELGHDNVKADGQDAANLTKLTLATAVSAGKDAGSRPTVRFFVTHARWNDEAKAYLSSSWVSGPRFASVFGNAKSGTSVGAQAEAWW